METEEMHDRRKEDHIHIEKGIPLYQIVLSGTSIVMFLGMVAWYQVNRDSAQDLKDSALESMIMLNTANIMKNSERDAMYQEYVKDALTDVKNNTQRQNDLLVKLIETKK